MPRAKVVARKRRLGKAPMRARPTKGGKKLPRGKKLSRRKELRTTGMVKRARRYKLGELF